MSRRQKGLRPFVENWQNVAARIIQRVHREATANPSDERIKGFREDLFGAGRFAAARPRIAFPTKFRRACRLIPCSSSSAPTAMMRQL
jgi:hypothetical protein